MVGYDVPVAVNTRAGLGIGYAHSKIDGKALSNSTAFNTYYATAYIAYEDGSWSPTAMPHTGAIAIRAGGRLPFPA
jgi:uncharacterized protein with beta-barrel porin domain